MTKISVYQIVLLLLSAVLAQAGVQTERLYLSGHDRDDAVRWAFRCATDGKPAGEWSTIPVPSNWEMHGFGTLSYHKDSPADVGEYRHNFTVPSRWTGQRVFLVFGGAMTDTTAKLNGQQVGPIHRGGFYQFEYEVTSLIRFDQPNQLEVTVAETSSEASVNRAERTGDYWNFGGIFRPVWLEAVPTQFIERVAIDARANGSFTANVVINGTGNAEEVVAQVRQLDGKPVGKPFAAKVVDGEIVQVNSIIVKPNLWTAETPNLYYVDFELRTEGKATHSLRERFGFRTFEVRKGDGFYLNGQKIVLQGANRHSFHPESGRCLAEKDHREDIRLMQEMNMNAVRMSHYPPDKRFLELCDELGLYVLDELAGWQKFYSAEAGRPLVAEMIQRDVNHPSILFWDNGNEGGWQMALDADYAKWDPQQRPVLHPWDLFQGINTSHYRNYDHTVLMAKGGFLEKHRDGRPLTETGSFIYMPTEFLHGLYDGGAGAGMEDYWNVMRTSPYAGGGFIWALVDEGVKRPDTGKIDLQGNAAPDGILGPYREKEASFYTIKELWSPVVVGERALPKDWDGTLSLENRYGFTNTSACKFSWELQRMPLPGRKSFAPEIVAKGSAVSPQIAPRQRGKLKLDLPAKWAEADVLALKIEDPKGRELWTATWGLPGNGLPKAATEIGAYGNKAELSETAGAIQIKAGNLTAEFSKTTGQLQNVLHGGTHFSLTNGPRVAVGGAKLESIKATEDGTSVVIQAMFSGAMKSVEWRVHADGGIDCEFAYTADKPSPYLGVCFDYPEELVKSKRWVGEGPYRVWQNRRRGVSLGAWENDYNDTITGYSGWVYPEFKGCFAGVRWLELETREGTITTVVHTDDLYVQVLTPSFPPAELQKASAIQMPQAGLAFLHVIPAMGEKFQPAETHGPQSQLHPVREIYRGKVSFRFGK